MVNLDLNLSGGHQIVQHLTSTDNADVFLGRPKNMTDGERLVAIKILRVDKCDVRRVKRFVAEAEFLSGINHSNIVSVIEFGTSENKRPYMVMPFYAGNLTLEMGHDDAGQGKSDSQDQAICLKYKRVKNIFRDVLNALITIHQMDMVHRDVKPSNIFLNDQLGSDVTLADFGLLKNPHDERFQDKIWMGSDHYASPEQRMNSRTVDSRADLYALGVVAYRALTGRLPGKISPPLRNLGLAVPKDFCHLIDSCLDYNVHRRPCTSTDALMRLGEIDDRKIRVPKPRPQFLSGKLLLA